MLRPTRKTLRLHPSNHVTPRAQRPELTLSNRARGKRARGQQNERLPFAPPEQWHEPSKEPHPYRMVYCQAGKGFRHVVTIDEVRNRLAKLPEHFLRPLQVVHFAQMTRKKRSAPCYGMQWGSAIYLYPIEADLVEHYTRPPLPSQLIEAKMYGGEWVQESGRNWKLVWTDEAIKDFYLNNILIHELGHLLDERNNRTIDRERYAEWFAIEYGYRASRA